MKNPEIFNNSDKFNNSDIDEYFMSIALREAKKGLGFTSPNPLVGAIIVKNGSIISRGFHKKIGQDHAEVDAIKKAKTGLLAGSTLYINLEPCCHYGKTPPCTDTIIKSGIKRVIVSTVDPDKRVRGRGLSILKKAGIRVKTGVLENESRRLNSIYFFFKEYNRPYIVLKSALTLDARIATFKNDSKWISNEKSREMVHKLRLRLKSIAVGRGTIEIDRPGLNCRLKGYLDKPVDKLIFSNERLNLDCLKSNPGKIYYVNNSVTADSKGFIRYCVENDIDSVLVEGGSRLYTWFIDNRLVDRFYLFYRPGFLGNDGLPIYSGKGIDQISKILNYDVVRTEIIDNNIMIELTKGEPICLLD